MKCLFDEVVALSAVASVLSRAEHASYDRPNF